jgi:hypothetical protein
MLIPNIPNTVIDELGRVHVTKVSHFESQRVPNTRKTELGRDLQRRADACRAKLNQSMTSRAANLLSGKAMAYEHAAELADASEPEPECKVSADGHCYPERDGHCHWCDNEVTT